MKVWYATVDGHEIRVENKLSDATLYIDDRAVDISGAVASVKLTGSMPSGEDVVAAMGQGLTGVQCKLIVGGRIVPVIRKYKF